MVVYESDLKKKALDEMRNCVSFIARGDMKKALYYYGKASVYEELLIDEGIDMEVVNDDYKEMKDIAWEKCMRKETKR